MTGIEEVAGACRAAGRFALDTEADSLHSYFHKVCLIQVSAGGRHFLVDPLALGKEGLGPLLEVIADPGIPVYMHGADYDVRVLDRDFQSRIGGLVDSQIMAHLLGESRTGLGVLLERELGVKQDKKFQRADWGRRPIPDQMLAYAAVDTAFLEALAGRLKKRLVALGRLGWVEEECRHLEQVRFHPPEVGASGFERLKGARTLKGAARDRAYSLYCWRDEMARRLDRPPFRVLGNRELLFLAENPAQTLGELERRPGVGPRFVRRWGREVLERLVRPGEAPARERTRASVQMTSDQRRAFKSLRQARDEVAERLHLEPGLMCPKALLEKIALGNAEPREAGDLEACGLEGWRLECLGEAFLEVMEKCRGDQPTPV